MASSASLTGSRSYRSLREAKSGCHAVGKAAISGPIWLSKAEGSPAIRTILSRLLSPATIARSRFGTRHSLARSSTSASLARPSTGGAVTETFNTGWPSAEWTMPSMRSARPRGVSRAARFTESSAALRGDLEQKGGKIVVDQYPQIIEEQNQDDRRGVDAAEIR